MLKKSIFLAIFLLLSISTCIFAEGKYLSDDGDQEATQGSTEEDRGPSLTLQDKAIDHAQQEFEDELQRLSASNATPDTTTASTDRQSEELRNLQTSQTDKKYQVSRSW